MECIEDQVMDHTEALEQMATERYLLDELTPEQREAFEEHLFDCQECVLDLRAGTAFVQEAKAQLPALTAELPRRQPVPTPRKSWLSWLTPAFSRPAFAAPVFAVMLLVIGYQNLVTVPALRIAANEPHVTPWTSLHTATRGAASIAVQADSKFGANLLVDLPTDPAYSSYSFELAGPDGKTAWTLNIPAPQENADNLSDGTESLTIPGAGLHAGAYTLTVFGVTSSGARTEIQRHVLDLHLHD
jgi:hypothetical protein